MNSNTVSKYPYSADYRSVGNGPSRTLGGMRDGVPSVPPGAALMVVVLSSLGLWAAIWLAVSSLASALLS